MNYFIKFKLNRQEARLFAEILDGLVLLTSDRYEEMSEEAMDASIVEIYEKYFPTCRHARENEIKSVSLKKPQALAFAERFYEMSQAKAFVSENHKKLYLNLCDKISRKSFSLPSWMLEPEPEEQKFQPVITPHTEIHEDKHLIKLGDGLTNFLPRQLKP